MSKMVNFKKTFYESIKNDVIRLKEYLDDAVVLDVGSNIGLFSLAVCKYVDYKELYLFEPVLDYFQHSKVLLKRHKNIHYNNIALGNTNSVSTIYKSTNDNIGWNTLLEKDPMQPNGFYNNLGKEEIRVRRLDDIYKDIKQIDFIKIDVEGYEGYVLEGGMELIRKFKPYLFIEVGWGPDHPEWERNKQIYEKIFNIGYQRIEFDNKTKNILFIPTDRQC